MVEREEIDNTLGALRSKYNGRHDTFEEPLYYSKLYLIELCGWIELTMDSIVRNCTSAYVSNPKSLRYLERSIIWNTSGFTYYNHFRPMLLQAFGLIKVEQLEARLDQDKFGAMTRSVDKLWGMRNPQAHTNIAGATSTVESPSTLDVEFHNVCSGLEDLESVVNGLSF